MAWRPRPPPNARPPGGGETRELGGWWGGRSLGLGLGPQTSSRARRVGLPVNRSQTLFVSHTNSSYEMFFCSRDTLDHLHNYTPKTNSTERLLYNEKPDFRSASLPSVIQSISKITRLELWISNYEAAVPRLGIRKLWPTGLSLKLKMWAYGSKQTERESCARKSWARFWNIKTNSVPWSRGGTESVHGS